MTFFTLLKNPWKMHKNESRLTFNFILYLPFSYSWILRKHMGDAKSVLDVGCGDGALMSFINRDGKYRVTGIDLFKEDLRRAKGSGAYARLIYGDIRKLKFKRKFDVVFASQVVEHLKKSEALKLIRVMEKMARKKVIIGTTNGFFPFDRIEGNDNNPLQVHKSGWLPEEMRELGYKVYGQGMGIIYKPGGLGHRAPILRIPLFLLSYIFSPFIYIFPGLSSYIVAIKNND